MKHTIEDIKEAVQNFIRTNGSEPTAMDFDTDPNLPNARYIQRNYGGLKNLRTLLNLTINDHTTGATRKKVAKEAHQRCKDYEAKLTNSLFQKLHDHKTFNPAVIRQYAYQQYIPKTDDYENISCDVAISYRVPSHIVMIDFFYPTTIHSLGGCVRSKISKLKKYPPTKGLYDCTHEILFVCVNPEFDQSTIDQKAPSSKYKTLSLQAFRDRFKV